MTQAARTRPAPIPDVANEAIAIEHLPAAGYSPAQGAQEAVPQETLLQETVLQEAAPTDDENGFDDDESADE